MCLSEMSATDRHGQSVSYLQLAHNRRNPVTGASTAEIIHGPGRTDCVEREGTARLVRSISHFLDRGEAVVASTGSGAEAEAIDSRPFRGAWVLDRLWCADGGSTTASSDCSRECRGKRGPPWWRKWARLGGEERVSSNSEGKEVWGNKG